MVSEFSDEGPTPEELSEAALDLVLETVEVTAEGHVVLHLTDSCGRHFVPGHWVPGHWPTAHFSPDGTVLTVTIEA